MKADMHIHTEYSPCSRMKINDLLKAAVKSGLDVIAVTDHNTIRGALAARRMNKNKKLQIIVGCEKKCEYGELLIYNLKREIVSNKFFEIIKEARRQGAYIFISHPIDYVRLNNSWKIFKEEVISLVDGFEAKNGRNVFNFLTKDLGKRFNKKVVAGSDSHTVCEVGNTYLVFKKDLWKEVMDGSAGVFHSHGFFSKLNSLTNGYFTKRFRLLRRLFSCQVRN